MVNVQKDQQIFEPIAFQHWTGHELHQNFHSKYTDGQTFDKTYLFHINFMFQIFFLVNMSFFHVFL